jgi:hypothetical protein
MLFYLRVTAAVGSVLSFLLLLPLWFHSYDFAHHIRWSVGSKTNFVVASKQGRLIALVFRWQVAPDFSRWGTGRVPVYTEASYPKGDMIQQTNALGFGRVTNPGYPELLSGAIAGAAAGGVIPTASYHGGVVVPFWFVTGLLAALAGALAIGRFWRFSTFSLLFLTTFIATMLGLFIFLDNLAASRQGNLP